MQDSTLPAETRPLALAEGISEGFLPGPRRLLPVYCHAGETPKQRNQDLEPASTRVSVGRNSFWGAIRPLGGYPVGLVYRAGAWRWHAVAHRRRPRGNHGKSFNEVQLS